MVSKKQKQVARNRTNCVSVPNDLFINILERLPRKSLLRFKCVCKQWCSLIRDHQKLLIVSGLYEIKTIDFESSTIEAVHHDFPIQRWYEPLIGNNVIGCCNGLLCIRIDKEKANLWNLSSGTYNKVHITDRDSFLDYHFGLGYDYSNNDYKIVKLFHKPSSYETFFQIYSLNMETWGPKATLPWLVDFELAGYNYWCNFGISVGGSLYWPVKFVKNWEFPRDGCLGLRRLMFPKPVLSILRFDLTDERFSLIHLPEDLIANGKSPITLFNLVDSGGSLCLVHYIGECDIGYSGEGQIDIWIVENWVKLISIPLEAEKLQKIFIKYEVEAVFCLTNGEFLLNIMSLDGTYGNALLLYNQEENIFKRLEIQVTRKYHCQMMTYTETIIDSHSPATYHFS